MGSIAIIIGLKLKLRSLTRPEVWAGAGLAEAAYEKLEGQMKTSA